MEIKVQPADIGLPENGHENGACICLLFCCWWDIFASCELCLCVII